MNDEDRRQLLIRLQASQEQIDAQVRDIMLQINADPTTYAVVDEVVTKMSEILLADESTAVCGFFLLFGHNKAKELWLNEIRNQDDGQSS